MKEVSLKEAAEIMKCSTQTVRRRILSGELKARKEVGEFGSRWLIPQSQLSAAVKDIETIDVTRKLTPAEIKNMMTDAVTTICQEHLVKAAVDGCAIAIKEETEELKSVIHELKEQLDKQNKMIEELKNQQKKNPSDKRSSFWSMLMGGKSD